MRNINTWNPGAKAIANSKNLNQTMSKAKKKAVIFRLWKYLAQHKILLITALLLGIIGNVLALAGPKLSGMAIDNIELGIGKVNFEKVYYYVFLMLIFFAISSIFSYFLSAVMINLSRKVVYRMRKELFDKLLKLPISFFDSHQIGDIISRISYDIDVINTSLSTDVVNICSGIITISVSLVMMMSISVYLAATFLITIPLSIIITKMMTKRTRPLFRKRSEKLGELNGFAEEMLTGHKTIKSYSKEKDTVKMFDEKNTEAVDAYYKADYYGTMVGPSVNAVNNLSLSLISLMGSIFYLFNMLSIGDISSFVLYSRKFSGPINEFANIISEFQSALAAGERVFNLLDEPEEKNLLKKLDENYDVNGNINIENLNFGYEKDKEVIHDLNLSVKKGQRIAIVGPTGAGKTTLINLLMRFYDVDDGKIYLDDRDIKNISLEKLRNSYAMVLQDTWLFNGTIFENVAYGKDTATLEEVENACKAAKIHSYIKRLPNGYNTIIREDGSNISKGQKQLLTIARAMLLDCKMLILDEATSNVDVRTEMMIQKAMINLMKEKTCFIIAHRLSTIQNSDLILVVNDGEIIEKGTHEELIAKNGFYKNLYDAQFE